MYGQNVPQYNQFNYYQYFYNPAALGGHTRSNVNLLYNQQLSDLSGAPQLGHLGLILPLSESSAVGLNLSNYDLDLFMITSATGSYAHTFQLGQSSFLSAGISLGAARTAIDTDRIADFSDPNIANALDASFSLSGQVGILFRMNNLSLNLSLPRVFDSNPISTEDFQEIEVAAMDNVVGSVSYAIELSPDLVFEPMIFAHYSDSSNSIYKGFATFYYKNFLWLGGSYELDLGPVVLAGVNIKDKISIGYAYEFEADNMENAEKGSHDIILRINLGKKKFDRPPLQMTTSTVTDDASPQEEQLTIEDQQEAEPVQPDKPEELQQEPAKEEDQQETKIENDKNEEVAQPVKSEPEKEIKDQEEKTEAQEDLNTDDLLDQEEVISQPVETQPADNTKDDMIKEETQYEIDEDLTQQDEKAFKDETEDDLSNEKTGGTIEKLEENTVSPSGAYHVVVGAFKNRTNASNYRESLEDAGHPAEVIHNAKADIYYVHVHSGSDKQAAIKVLERYRQMSEYQFQDAWLFKKN